MKWIYYSLFFLISFLPLNGVSQEEKNYKGTLSLSQSQIHALQFKTVENRVELPSIQIDGKPLARLSIPYEKLLGPLRGEEKKEEENSFKTPFDFNLHLYRLIPFSWGGAQAPEPDESILLNWKPLEAFKNCDHYTYVGLGSWEFVRIYANEEKETGFFSFGEEALQDQKALENGARHYAGEFFNEHSKGLAWLFLNSDGTKEISFFFPETGDFIKEKIELTAHTGAFKAAFTAPNEGTLQGVFYGPDGSEVAGTFSLKNNKGEQVKGAFVLKGN